MNHRKISQLILFLLLGFISIQLFGHDVIIMCNGDGILAKMEEVGQNEIRYKKFENLTGPNFSVSKARNEWIERANKLK